MGFVERSGNMYGAFFLVVAFWMGFASCQQQMPLPNGDFEQEDAALFNSYGPNPVVCTADINPTIIQFWKVVENGVEILSNAQVQASPTAPKSSFCLHMNTQQIDTHYSSQGVIQTELTFIPSRSVLYNVSFDIARHPDGGEGTSLQHTVLENDTPVARGVHQPVYNSGDTRENVTWSTRAFLFPGGSLPTTLRFASLSSNYGSLIDNVKIFQLGDVETPVTPVPDMTHNNSPQKEKIPSKLLLTAFVSITVVNREFRSGLLKLS